MKELIAPYLFAICQIREGLINLCIAAMRLSQINKLSFAQLVNQRILRRREPAWSTDNPQV
ncbi:hypothetical protein XpopCFBP1817_15195 [Xanthomonas populi]|uniref:Uncharacterized protein n=1 Tax=Xanthomonas populi TaxID=53414 RepID=A0A2S7ELM0_9XANT|nr:hypothetical protein XpopCFBP1817_15195 [Xanthomonas populi]